MQNGALATVRWHQTDNDGNDITYELKALDDAKSTVESHVAQDSSSDDGASDGAVDQKNLTSAQMEHWVRSVIKSGSQEYNADDYSFTQAFVDGYAQVNEYAQNPNSGKKDLLATYRVNGDGYLEMKNDNTANQWTVVSQSYY